MCNEIVAASSTGSVPVCRVTSRSLRKTLRARTTREETAVPAGTHHAGVLGAAQLVTSLVVKSAHAAPTSTASAPRVAPSGESVSVEKNSANAATPSIATVT